MVDIRASDTSFGRTGHDSPSFDPASVSTSVPAPARRPASHGSIRRIDWRASRWRSPGAARQRHRVVKRCTALRERLGSALPRRESPMRPFRIVTLSAFIAAALVSGCKQNAEAPAPATPAPAAAATNDNAALASAVDAFITGSFEHNPVFAANAGKHEFDGKLPDYSAAGLKATADWLHAQRTAFAAFTDDKLDEKSRFQRDYVLAVIDGQLFWLEESGFPYDNPAFYSGDLSPSMYLTRPYAPLPQRMAAFVTYQEALPKALAQVKANLKLPLPATYIDLGVNSFGGYATFFKNDVPGIFAEVKDDALQARFRASNAAAIKATQDLADWFKAQKPQATQGFAFGAEKFSKMLHATELVDMPLDQLKAVGEADLQRNLDALKAACDQFDAGKTLAECVEKVNAD